MLDYTQSFEEFSKSVTPLDLALYAGVGLVLWVLFKDKLSPVQVFVASVVNKIKTLLESKASTPKPTTETPNLPTVVPVSAVVVETPTKEDIFFKLIISWKETRDLAAAYGCEKAVEAADNMFPYLSPNICSKESTNA